MITQSEIGQLSAQSIHLLQTGRFAEAIEAFRQLVAAAPEIPDAWYNLGYLERNTRQFEAALVSYEEAIKRNLQHPEDAYVNRAAILSDHLLRPDEAEQELLKALAIEPYFLVAWHNLGQLREDRNDISGARQAYGSAIAIAPYDGRAHARIAAIDVFEGQAAAVVKRLEAPLQAVRDDAEAAELEFAVANALDAMGHYDAAFERFRHANRRGQSASRTRYDASAQDRLVDDIISAFPTASHCAPTAPDPLDPIFVCGMFRSGSTLCEQVLARHSIVTAGGELDEILAMTSLTLAPYPASIGSISQERFTGLKNSYLHSLGKLFPGASIVTDKRPDNFMHIGLIKAMWPAARIVNTIRNPLDNILSVFFLYFADSVAYSSRIEDIDHYYQSYSRLMAHWRRLYPDIIEFNYDAFVASPQLQARTLFAACGLEWEVGCDPTLAVNTDVRTASAWQVRQPVHARSAGRWRNYSEHINHLQAALHYT